MCVCVCVCVRECMRACERASVSEREREREIVCICVCVCVKQPSLSEGSIYAAKGLDIHTPRYQRGYTHTHTHTHTHAHLASKAGPPLPSTAISSLVCIAVYFSLVYRAPRLYPRQPHRAAPLAVNSRSKGGAKKIQPPSTFTV